MGKYRRLLQFSTQRRSAGGLNLLVVSATAITALGMARPAQALVITPIFETSWTSNAPSVQRPWSTT